jgi:hypothetical protein
MGTSDGFVIGTTKIVDHGPASQRWNMVILSEGYRAGEMNQYHADAQAFVDHLYGTAPFNELWCGVNIYRVDVASTDSGAADPATCGDGSTGSGAAPHTYFDASFCTNSTRRLLQGNETNALAVSHAQVPQGHVTMVIVNSPIYGGAGGGVAWFSTNVSSPEIGIHEMGHTFFGFLDEYGDIYNTYAGGEPAASNATIDTNRATTKWGTLIAAATPLPTTSNPNCAAEDNRPSPVPAGTVGLFEGAARAHCGAYRAEYDCRMRHLGVAFCAVCQRRIRQLLTPFIVPTTVNLTTPSVSFGNVPAGVGSTGVTTYRAIKFDITSCNPVTLQIVTGPAGGFGAPGGTSVPVPPAELTPVAQGRLWISYTSTTAGSCIMGSVTVQAVDTVTNAVFGPWIVNLSACTIARPTSAVMLVLDRSGSMATDAGNGHSRVELLRTAVSTFVDVMQSGDGLGIVRFDDLVDTLMPVTDVGPAPAGAGRTQAHNIVTTHDPALTLDPRGATSIGGGIQQAKTALDAAPPSYSVRAMVVLTDGLENTRPMIAEVSGSLTANTFAIGFGQAAAISTAALNAITQGHGGYLVITGPITPDENFALTEYFLKIQAGIQNTAAVLDPRGELVYGVTHRIPFALTSADMGIDAIVLSPAPYYIDFRLEAPDGTIITQSEAGVEPAIQFVATPRVSYYRAALPMLAGNAAGSHDGQWYALLSLGDRAKNVDAEFIGKLQNRALPYSLLVHAYSNLQFEPGVTQNSFEPGATVKIHVALSQYNVPLDGHAAVWAEISQPDSSSFSLTVPETEAGRFAANFVASQSGVYTVRLRAQGSTLEGQTFQREQRFTAVVFPGGDQPPQQPRDDRLCQLLMCLLSGRVIGGELLKELEARGLNLGALEECVKQYCHESDEGLGGEHRFGAAAPGSSQPGSGLSQFTGPADIRQAISDVLRELRATEGKPGFADLKAGGS